MECDEIISSSLHGIVIAEAYGIPCKWILYGNEIEGGEFKYQDYFLGTNRKIQQQNKILDPIENLKEIQKKIIFNLNQL